MINVEQFTKVIENSDSDYLLKKHEVLYLLRNYKQNEISIDKISSFLEKKESYLNRIETKFAIENGKQTKQSNKSEEDCTLGTDLGCCGNYSGCCWYWSYYCLDHDLACYLCDKWHCGPACEPGPVE